MPKTFKADAKRCALNMRTTPEMRGLLEAAASASGRSLAQEVEYRLQQSFDHPALIRALADELNARREERYDALQDEGMSILKRLQSGRISHGN